MKIWGLNIIFWNPIRLGWFNWLNRSGQKTGKFKPSQPDGLDRKRVKLNQSTHRVWSIPGKPDFQYVLIVSFWNIFSTFPFLISTFYFLLFSFIYSIAGYRGISAAGTLWRLTGKIDLDETWFTSLYWFQLALSSSFSNDFYLLAEPVTTPVSGWTYWSGPVYKTIFTINLLACIKLCVFY